MTFDYSSISNTALQQIADKGRAVSLVYKTEGDLDIDNDRIDGDSEKTVKTRGLFTRFKQNEVDGTLIQANDKRVLVAATGLAKPKTNDVLIDSEKQLTVVDVEEVKPGDTAIIYRIQVRG